MDLKEFVTPIRYYIDDPIIIQVSPDYESESRIEIAPGKTELIDHLFKYWEKISYKFVHVKNIINKQIQHYPSNDNIVASIKIVLDRKMIIYGRVADTVLEGLEKVGGFYESLHLIGHMFVFFIS